MLIKKTKIPFKAVLTEGVLPSFLKKLYYRQKGFQIGKKVTLGFGSVIIGQNVVIEDGVKTGLFTIIRANEIKIERYVTIGSFTIIDTGKLRVGEDARINEQVIIGGMKTPDSSLDLGKRTIIMEYSFINTTMPITIGDDSGIGGHCLLFTHGSWLNQLEGFPVTFAPITLGKSVWLPWRVFIMPGVVIGDKVVVGANSLISKSVESNSLVAGSPAKIIKENYPLPISAEKKLEIFNQFISDFLDHLTYHGVEIKRIEDTKTSTIKGNFKGKNFVVLIHHSYEQIIKNDNIDTLIITNITHGKIIELKTKGKKIMQIDIFNKTRIGNSDIGEEFVKFVSRYGLRFSRLD